MARAQFEQALPYADVSDMVAERLSFPERALIVAVRCAATTARWRSSPGYRVQHSTVLGPTKGGIRYDPEVSLGECAALAIVDDVEVRAAAAAVRRREGRHPLRPARAVAARARAAHAPVHVGARARDRPADRHPGARHGDERADDGVDDGHVLDADGPRRAGGRDRQADLRRRLDLPPRGDRRRRRDDRRARVPAARLARSTSSAASCRASATSAASRHRSCTTRARTSSRSRTSRAASTTPARLDIPELHAYVVEHGSLEGYDGVRADHERGAARAAVRHARSSRRARTRSPTRTRRACTRS